jgi:hypothetical protein
MATSEEKTELVETIKGPRFYRLVINGYGGEGAYINISKEAYEFWNDVNDDYGDGDFVQYLVNDDPDEIEYEEIESVPPEADFLTVKGEDYKQQWYEAEGEFCHQYGVEYGSAWMSIDEVDGADYSAAHITEVIENKTVSDLIDEIGEETDWEVELHEGGNDDWYEKQGDYVAQMYSSEKGSFFDATIETVGEFDPKKLKFYITEYPNGEDCIDSVSYDGEELDNNGGDTNGKGYYGHVWTNLQND